MDVKLDLQSRVKPCKTGKKDKEKKRCHPGVHGMQGSKEAGCGLVADMGWRERGVWLVVFSTKSQAVGICS